MDSVLMRLVREDDGLEVLDWSLLFVIAALASAVICGKRVRIGLELTRFGNCVTYNLCK